MRRCNICKEQKEETNFTKNEYRCRKCKSAYLMKLRLKNSFTHERNKKYQRELYLSKREERLASQKKYIQTENGKEITRKGKEAWSARNKEKTSANLKAQRAVRSGALVKQPCEVCGSIIRIHAHHDDYSRPLDIRWLCPTHHSEWHRQDRERKRQEALNGNPVR